jgi:uncharacterized protein (DUF362 family)
MLDGMAPRPVLALALLAAGCGTKDLPRPAPSATASAPPTIPADAPTADAVTQASAPYDAGPSVIADGGSVDGAALRKRHKERLLADREPVTVLRGDGALDLGKRLCEAVVPRRHPGTKVLLKPNLCGFDSIKDPEKHHGDDGVHGRTTEVEFTRGVVRCLKARGHAQVTIAEGCGISHKHWLNVARITGYDAMAREEGVSLVALDDDGVFDVEGDKPGKPLHVSGIANTRVPNLLLAKVLAEHLDHGLFLSLPKIKAHRYSIVSVGIKGMQGVVMLSDQAPTYKQKWRMHKELNAYLDKRKGKGEDGEAVPPEEDRALYVAGLMAFAERMADVLEIATPDAVLAEGAPAMGGDGFQRLVPSAEHVAIGGTNPVLVDRVAAAFLGLHAPPGLARELGGHPTSPLLEVAARRYKVDLKSPAITGDGASLLESPRPVHFKAIAPFSLDWAPPGTPAPATYVFPSAAPRAEPAPVAVPVSAHAPSPASPGHPEAHAASSTDPITLDGRADEPAWARATPVRWETDYAGHPTGIATQARFLWRADGLYALFELSSAALTNTDTSQPAGEERVGLYKEDCVELFLTPDAAHPKRYYEVELGPFGHYYDIDVDRERGKHNVAWSSGAVVATRRDPAGHEATIEVKLGAPEIIAALRPGARLPLGLYRIEGKKERTYLAWSPPRTAKPNFHVPEAFGVLVIDPP